MNKSHRCGGVNGDSSVSGEYSGCRAHRPAQAHPRDALARKETVADFSQGVQLATVQKLARYWATEYDWRKVEARLNAVPNFITEIDGLDIHFIHVRSKHENALPRHRHARLAGLDRRAAQAHRAADQSDGAWRHRSRRLPRGDSVHAGLRLFGQAHRTGWGPERHRACLERADEAPRLHELRGAGRRLGRDHHRAHGRAGAARDCWAFTPTWPT